MFEQIIENTYIRDLVIFAVLFLAIKIVHILIKKGFASFSKKTSNTFDDLILSMIKSVKNWFLLYLSFYLIFSKDLGVKLSSVGDKLFLVLLSTQIVIIINTAVKHYTKIYIGKEENDSSKSAALFIQNIIRAVIWVIALLFVLSNLGVNITSLAASLGIGGIAIAIALQNILVDLFSSFSIFFDKPFEIGDTIMIDGKMGTVEKIGIKTTRLRALQGEQIVISNSDLTSSRIQNFKRLEERRVVFNVGVSYDTPKNVLEKIPGIIKSAHESVSDVRFDRSNLLSFGDSSIIFENVYYVNSSDYATYMNKNEKIMLSIFEKFTKEKIEIAYPTQTIIVKK